ANSSTGADEKPPIVTEVERQGGVLDNHEDRITNAEGDITSLQDQTGSTPSTERVVVREVAPKPITVSDEPEPIVVVSYKQIPLDGGNVDCEYTYSDGTKYRWNWKKVNPQGAWVTDGSGNNGHWVASTNTKGVCDNSAIGKIKTN